MVRIYLGPLPVYLVTSPELAWQVPATNAGRFDKGILFDKIRPLAGNGLANSNGDFHRRQRRLVQPTLHRKRIAGYVHTMAQAADDIPRLEYTRRIISEVLRKYPILLLMRRARTDVDLGGVYIQPGTEVALSQYALHHDPHLYPDPARFDPDRWLPDQAAKLPRGAFIPFGAGPPHCPGYIFAETEIAIVATTVAARWRLVPVAGKPVHPRTAVTMHPNRLPMVTIPRHT